MRKAALHNLGCKVNAYETEAMQQLLEENGYEIVDFNEKADVYVVNTCSVTNMADRKSRQMLHRAKKMNPKAVVVAAGCYVQAAKDTLKEDMAVDIIIGNNKKTELVGILDRYFIDKNADSCVIDIAQTKEYESLKVSRISDHTRAFIKVTDGCNQFCSYCIIPYTRGRVRSRDLSDIKKEVTALSKSGYKEIVLTGIHLSSYGIDFQDEHTGLIDLICSLSAIEAVKRIRLGSLEPRIITEEFVKRLSGIEKICPHFHLSLQSGSDATLSRMNRRYNTKEYEESCKLLRRYFDNPAITTDVIVGFPGETDEEFNTTKNFLSHIHFYEMHIFKYSIRQGTKAAVMLDQIPEQIKDERSDILIKLNKTMSDEYRKCFIGKTCEVLLEEKMVIDNEEFFIGHTKEYIKTAVKDKGYMPGHIINVKLTGELCNDIMLSE